MKKILPLAATLIAAATLTACGGGGGSDKSPAPSVTPTVKKVSLKKFNSTAVGVVYKTDITEVDSAGTNYTGQFSITNLDQEVKNGVLTTPRKVFVTSTVVGQTTVAFTSTATSYYDSSTANLISMYLLPAKVTCTSSSPYHMPDEVKVGDSDTMSTLTCDDKETLEGSWRVEDADGGNIKLISNLTTKNGLGSVSTSDIEYTLDSTGTIIAVKDVIVNTTNGFKVTFQSK